MSLSDEEKREPYIDLMAEPVVSGLGGVEGVLLPGEDHRLRVSAAIDLVMPYMAKVDWESRAVEPPIDYTKATFLDPYERSRTGHADRLASAAFDDAQFLFDYAGYTVRRAKLPEGAAFGRILLDSERTLLTVSRLDDKYKDKVLEVLQRGADMAEAIIGISVAEGPLQVRTDGAGRPVVGWVKEIEAWIRSRTHGGESGCPAHKKIIEADGRKMSLMHFFWDKLVRATYEV